MFALLALLALSLTATAQDPDCVTRFAGVLAANVSGTLKAFTLSPAGQITYLGDGKAPLVAQFQQCQTFEQGEPPSAVEYGRLFVPGQGECVAVANQAAAAPPYFTTLQACGVTEPQKFTEQFGSISWVGAAASDGTVLQGGCNLLGYTAGVGGAPVIIHTDNQVTLECAHAAPFHLTVAVN